MYKMLSIEVKEEDRFYLSERNINYDEGCEDERGELLCASPYNNDMDSLISLIETLREDKKWYRLGYTIDGFHVYEMLNSTSYMFGVASDYPFTPDFDSNTPCNLARFKS